MYGVMDETGMLQYGQVFVQYSPNVRVASMDVITHIGKREWVSYAKKYFCCIQYKQIFPNKISERLDEYRIVDWVA